MSEQYADHSLPHNSPVDPQTMTNAAMDNVLSAKQGLTDPASIWYGQHAKVRELEAKTLATMARYGHQPTQPDEPHVVAEQMVHEQYEGADLAPGSLEIIDQRMEALAALQPGERIKVDPTTGAVVQKTPEEIKAAVEVKLGNMSPDMFKERQNAIIRELGEARYHREQTLGSNAQLSRKSDANLHALGRLEYDDLIERAAKAVEGGKQSPRFAYLVSDLGVLRLLAATGTAAYHRDRALAGIVRPAGVKAPPARPAPSIFDWSRGT
jgi:hypothetical protein